jgi:hypothetical protein
MPARENMHIAVFVFSVIRCGGMRTGKEAHGTSAVSLAA